MIVSNEFQTKDLTFSRKLYLLLTLPTLLEGLIGFAFCIISAWILLRLSGLPRWEIGLITLLALYPIKISISLFHLLVIRQLSIHEVFWLEEEIRRQRAERDVEVAGRRMATSPITKIVCALLIGICIALLLQGRFSESWDAAIQLVTEALDGGKN